MATFDVLVVDDEKDTRQGLAELLAVKRISADTAPDGRTALQKLDTEDFRVVLLDVRLPDIDGLDVLARCARVRSPARIIMMTGMDTSETVLAALRGKAYDFLPKPVNPTALVETVRSRIATLSDQPVAPPPSARASRAQA